MKSQSGRCLPPCSPHLPVFLFVPIRGGFDRKREDEKGHSQQGKGGSSGGPARLN